MTIDEEADASASDYRVQGVPPIDRGIYKLPGDRTVARALRGCALTLVLECWVQNSNMREPSVDRKST